MSQSNNAINNTVGASISGVTNTLTITNPSDTASSAARATITVGGSSAADPSLNFNVNGVTNFEMGIDNGSSDSFKIAASAALGTSDVFVMTTSGERTLPLQPAFTAHNSGALSNVTGDGTTYTVILDTEDFDQNSDYNNTTGIFTAPIAGKYLFTFNLSMSGMTSAHTSGILQITTSGGTSESFRGNVYAARGVDGITSVSGSFLIDLDAAETSKLTLTVSGGTKVVSVPAGINTYFCGYLCV